MRCWSGFGERAPSTGRASRRRARCAAPRPTSSPSGSFVTSVYAPFPPSPSRGRWGLGLEVEGWSRSLLTRNGAAVKRFIAPGQPSATTPASRGTSPPLGAQREWHRTQGGGRAGVQARHEQQNVHGGRCVHGSARARRRRAHAGNARRATGREAPNHGGRTRDGRARSRGGRVRSIRAAGGGGEGARGAAGAAGDGARAPVGLAHHPAQGSRGGRPRQRDGAKAAADRLFEKRLEQAQKAAGRCPRERAGAPRRAPARRWRRRAQASSRDALPSGLPLGFAPGKRRLSRSAMVSARRGRAAQRSRRERAQQPPLVGVGRSFRTCRERSTRERFAQRSPALARARGLRGSLAPSASPPRRALGKLA